MTGFHKTGEVLDHIATAEIKSNDVVVLRDSDTAGMVGVAVTDIKTGESGAVNRTGIIRAAKATGAVNQYDDLYFHKADRNFTTTKGTGSATVGPFLASAASAAADGFVWVLISK